VVGGQKFKKIILLYCCTLTYDDVQWYSNITFFLIFAVFDVRRSVAVNMCMNCSFYIMYVLIFSVFRNCVSQFCDCIVSDSRFYIYLKDMPAHEQQRGRASPSAYAARSAATIYGSNILLTQCARARSTHFALIRLWCRNFSLLMQHHSIEPR